MASECGVRSSFFTLPPVFPRFWQHMPLRVARLPASECGISVRYPLNAVAHCRTFHIFSEPPDLLPPTPAAQHRSQQTPLARLHNLGVVHDAVACRRAPRFIKPASGAAEACVGRSLTPYAPGHARGAPPVPRRGCRIAPRERGALMRGCGGRAPSGAARGGQDSVRLPYSPRVPPACAVGARPPPRYPRRRPTALAADTAGAASNLGVFYTRVMCRCAPRSINPASGAAEAGVGRPIKLPPWKNRGSESSHLLTYKIFSATFRSFPRLVRSSGRWHFAPFPSGI